MRGQSGNDGPFYIRYTKREPGKYNPYLKRDKELQEIVNRHGNLYINDGSIRATDLLPGEMMQPAEWKEGNCLYLTVNEQEIEIVTQSVKNNRKHARGYYRIRKQEERRR